MSQRPISRSDDLQRLRADGYDIVIQAGHLLVRDVPYVNRKREVARGVLVSELTFAGDVTCPPSDHVAYFIGEEPCDSSGTPLSKIINACATTERGPGLVINYSFSSKPTSGKYANYHEKMRTYVAILAGYAQVLDPAATAKTFPVVAAGDEDGVFEYEDTASSRANITTVTQKLATGNLAIIGMGGTGSYTLDLVAKTPVPQIHLYDGDRFLQHNAFRSPGAPSREELEGAPNKAAFFQGRYARMRRGIVAHPYYIEAENVEELRTHSFVFICIDRSASRKLIIEKLNEFGISFIDVGMGIPRADNALGAIVRVTTSTPSRRAHVSRRVPLADVETENEYSRNIQVADLNALNAALAVVRWKKLAGFYLDAKHEHHTTYTVSGNLLLNEDDE